MKLIIDISDHLYTVIKNKECTHRNVLTEAVYDGIPLDKLKAEIAQMPSEMTADGRRMIRRGSVFRIIDKYKGE